MGRAVKNAAKLLSPEKKKSRGKSISCDDSGAVKVTMFSMSYVVVVVVVEKMKERRVPFFLLMLFLVMSFFLPALD